MEPEAKRSRVERVKGIAPILSKYIKATSNTATLESAQYDDEHAEGAGLSRLGGNNSAPGGSSAGGGKKRQPNPKKNRGQNKQRNLVQKKETIRFCEREKDENGKCPFGDSCRFEHDLTKYLATKPVDLEGECPVFAALGYCPAGIKCRWLSSHWVDNKSVRDEDKAAKAATVDFELNRVNVDMQHKLQRKQYDLTRSELYIKRMAEEADAADAAREQAANPEADEATGVTEVVEQRAAYLEGSIRPIEKKKLNYANAKVLSPLTTVGNLPYRRLMKTLGADVTFSEMALSLPLIQGSKSEWALPRMHSSEQGNFVVQIAAPKPWHAVKAAQLIAELAPGTSEMNLNCGCPIDLLYRQGAGSALMDNPAKILRITRGMAAVSGEVPVTIKLRTGTRDGHPTAMNLVKRLVDEQQVAAITLHGRSRQQRYTKEADWDYIKQVADQIKLQREDKELKPWIIGNGDVYSYEDWYEHIEKQGVDTCMVARGALIKPWLFEEIDAKQYIDKSATERLEYLKQYAAFGLAHWGSDEYGVNQTRRFLCEWMSFTHRYIPVGILEYLPPKLNDRPPPWEGRNELETLLASGDYRDWIKVSEMFLGPVSESFEFEPKHKSNSYS